ncbi:MAG: putative LPS assembly protein LptD [Gemmatimonadota bacterium]
MRRSRGAAERRAARFLGVLALMLSAAPLQAQEPDSTRIRVFERLRQLARPPGLDSALLVDDSTAAARAGRGPQARGGAAAFDSVAAELMRLSGYEVTTYEGAGATFGAADRRLSLLGAEGARPVVRRDDFELSADTAIDFDEERGLVTARGEAEFKRPGGEPLTTRQLIYDLNEDRGTALGARTVYNEGADWRVAGDLTSVEPGLFWGRHISFTSCELDEPHYHFATGEIKWLSDDWFVARNVTLRFADVPVMWLPFIAQGLGQGRSSGLLAPTFSVNDIVRTSGSYRRRVSNLGFYWAMSDYTDAKLAMDWFSERFFSLQGSFNYLWARQFLRGGVNYRQYWEAEGGTNTTLNTTNNWEINERTSLAIGAAWATSTDFVRRESRNPLELIQSIDSDARFTRRLDWGSLNVGANRKQFLSNDKVTMTLPTVSLSLTPLTFFKAPTGRERWYNNLSWSGGMGFTRDLTDNPALLADSTFNRANADLVNTRGNLNSGFNLGGFGFSQSVSFNERITRDVPGISLFEPGDTAVSLGVSDLAEATVDWSTTLDYQMRALGGSLTFTPRLRMSGQLLRSDEIPDASEQFVAGPRRSSFGATLKSDIYGFWGGFGRFERIRHKISPSFDYDYAPAVTPTELQRRVFTGAREIRRQNQIAITLNQTFEAKLNQDAARQADSVQSLRDSLAVQDSIAIANDTTGLAPQRPLAPPRAGPDALAGRPEPERPGPGTQPVQLLGLSLSAVQYDFVRADSLGRWEEGVQNQEIQGRVTSDYLRGLSVSFSTDLFDERAPAEGAATEKVFDMHLSTVNLGFSLGSNSALFRWLGFLKGRPGAEVAEEGPPPDDPLSDLPGAEEVNIVPRTQDPFRSAGPQRRGGGGFNASFQYSLQRPRNPELQRSELLTANVNFSPTQSWDVTWRTSYDREEGRFLDHIVRLTRDLHRWDAHFDFIQTVTGTWTFRFEVQLKDNQDLKFDYEQRSLDATGRR